MRRVPSFILANALMASAVALVGCAQDVGDIDRTQVNISKKSDFLQGEWYFRQTVTDAPATTAAYFEGYTSNTEKIVWEIQEDHLIGYRAYEVVPGADVGAAGDNSQGTRVAAGQGDGQRPDVYKGNPIISYPIQGHFDIVRGYNTSTGEQTNVIEENSSDRPWYEREYMRVDWGTNEIGNLNFFWLDTAWTAKDIGWFVQEEEGGEDAFFKSYDDVGAMDYFDFTNKMGVSIDFGDCITSLAVIGVGDCGAQEVKVRSSFRRVPDQTFQPVFYDDRDMSKFGYFRTERVSYDRLRGATDAGRIYLASVHNIWEDAVERNADGTAVFDAEGQWVYRPFSERTAKPVVYYTSPHFPAELFPYAQNIADGWSDALRRSVAAAKGIAIPTTNGEMDMSKLSEETVPRMFHVCHNPVSEADDPACGEVGMLVRMGDLRYNVMWWVDENQPGGPLGYGPAATDPETGEIISATAYIYGGAVDTYANYALDTIRLINEDFDLAEFIYGEAIAEEIVHRLNATIDPRADELGHVHGMEAISPALFDLKLEDLGPHAEGLLSSKVRARIKTLQSLPDPLEALASKDRMHEARVQEFIAEFDDLLVNDEIVSARTHGLVRPGEPIPTELWEDVRPSNWLGAKMLDRERERIDLFAKRNIFLQEFADDSVMHLALQYKDRPVEEAYYELRGKIFQAVEEHEVGHTLGLRHNFQGSFDALNFHDEYWDLRKENLARAADVGSMLAQARQTAAQEAGGMREFEYSSIMDYGLNWNTDLQGLGKYDNAAILYAYSTGVYEDGGAVEDGYVEVYSEPGPAAVTLRDYDNRANPSDDNVTEEYHYTTIVESFPTVESMRKRELVRYSQLRPRIESQDASRPVEVPYMFCSDEYVGAIASCHRWDAGPDPLTIVDNVIRNWREYYFFNNFKRQRLGFDANSVLNRSMSRYFSYLPIIYQNWVFTLFGNQPDNVMSTNYLMGATAGMNFLGDVMTTPSYGTYAADLEGVYRLQSLDQQVGAGSVYVEMGQGRRQFSQYDFEDGYYWYDKIQEAGHFWDWLAAVFSFTTSQATVIGADVDADFRTYTIPYYLLFEEPVSRLFNAMFLEDYEMEGPRIVDGVYTPAVVFPIEAGGQGIDPLTGAPYNRTNGNVIDVGYSFTQRIYALLLGMANFTSNYSMHYVDQAQVFRRGGGEEFNPGADWDKIWFTDPSTGHQYGAFRSTVDDPDPDKVIPVNVAMVQRGQALEAEYNAAIAEGRDNDANQVRFELGNVVESLNLMRDMYDAFGRVF